MKINIDELGHLGEKRFTIAFSQELPVSNAVKPVVGEILVARTGVGVKVTGNVKTLLKLACQTCLRPYFQSLSVDLDELFVPYNDFAAVYQDGTPRQYEREKELLKDDFYEELGDDGDIDISDVVYQAVTLASPVFCRCGNECPGPPRPENTSSARVSEDVERLGPEEKPIDPRWKNLKSLFPKQE